MENYINPTLLLDLLKVSISYHIENATILDLSEAFLKNKKIDGQKIHLWADILIFIQFENPNLIWNKYYNFKTKWTQLRRFPKGPLFTIHSNFLNKITCYINEFISWSFGDHWVTVFEKLIEPNFKDRKNLPKKLQLPHSRTRKVRLHIHNFHKGNLEKSCILSRKHFYGRCLFSKFNP